MKKLVLIFIVALFLPLSAWANTGGEAQGTISNLVKTFSTLQEISGQLTKKDIALKYEQDLIFPSLIEIEQIDKALVVLNTELEDLENKFLAVINRTEGQYDDTDEALVEGLIKSKQETIDRLQIERVEYEERYENRKNKQQENIKLLRDDLENIQEEKDKQWKLIRAQGMKALNYLVIIIGLILFFWALRWGSGKIISRFASHFNEHRRKALQRLNHIVFNTILVIIILGLFFSQISTFLPFLAILGTGLAFAVRDTIASFIAWFVIGGDGGYRLGQIIEVEGVTGRVLMITPLMTKLIDQSPGYTTGEVITFPNKVIFEHKVIHKSYNMQLKPLELSFILSEKSDLAMAKEKLESFVKQLNEATIKMLEEQETKVIKQTPFELSDFEIKVWEESCLEGIALKARFLVHYQELKPLESKIRDHFTHWAGSHEKVFLQFTNVGRHS